VQDRARHALPEHGHQGSTHLGARAGQGDRAAAVEVLTHEERVDFGGGAPEDGGLVVEGNDLGLREVGRRQDLGHCQRLQDVVQSVGHQAVRRLAELPADVGGVHVGALGRGHPQVARDVLQPE